MSCKTGFTQIFLHETFTKQFMNTTYKESRKNILFEREKAIFPNCQNDVKDAIIERKINKKICELQLQAFNLQKELKTILNELGNLKKEKNETKKVSIVKATTHKCMYKDCRGFLDESYYCNLCENTTCDKCNEVKEEDHECKNENIETVKLLKKDSKTCPGCGVFITKINGCSQMWCTSCHTVFDFNTGQKVNGIIHNPHYYEFHRNHNTLERNPLDIPCGGLPEARIFLMLLNGAPIDHNIKNTMIKIHRNISHIIGNYLPRNPIHDIDINENRELRIGYLLKEIDEEEFKDMTYKKERAKQIQIEFDEILTMVTHTSSELIRDYTNEARERKRNWDSSERHWDPSELLQMLENLRVYANTNFKKIGKLFNRKYPKIYSNYDYEKYCNV